MVVVLKKDATEEQKKKVIDTITSYGLEYKIMPGIENTVIAMIGDERGKPLKSLETLAGVEEVFLVEKPYKLVSREAHPEYNKNEGTMVIDVCGVKVGGPKPIIIAGPCAVESLEQTLKIAHAIKEAGADMLRGGAYKPRTSPYDFQGLGEEGLKILDEARKQTGLPIVTEVMESSKVDIVAQYADVLQIGARNMQNFNLLEAVGKQSKPVLLKRGGANTVTEWLCAAEYIAMNGNNNIILCERGVKGSSVQGSDRNPPDFGGMYNAKKHTYLPILFDPSHSTGDRDMILPASLSGIAYGANGLIIEIVRAGEEACNVKCDYKQSIEPDKLKQIVRLVNSEKQLLDS